MLICIQSYHLVLRSKDFDLSKQNTREKHNGDLINELMR